VTEQDYQNLSTSDLVKRLLYIGKEASTLIKDILLLRKDLESYDKRR
jgi:hypothetical protein